MMSERVAQQPENRGLRVEHWLSLLYESTSDARPIPRRERDFGTAISRPNGHCGGNLSQGEPRGTDGKRRMLFLRAPRGRTAYAKLSTIRSGASNGQNWPVTAIQASFEWTSAEV